MTVRHDLERRIADLYAAEAPHRAPDRVLEQALATIDITRQRRELRLVPWRYPTMNSYAKLAVGAAVVLAVGAFAFTALRPGQGPSVGGPNASASTPPAPSPSPSSSQPVSPPPLTESFTSPIHGLSVSYPAGWLTVPATEAWTTQPLHYQAPAADTIYDPGLTDHLFIGLASRDLAGEPGDTWATAFLADSTECDTPDPITVDGAEGLICGGLATTWTADRGYVISIYLSPDDPELPGMYDRDWLDQLLATVDLPSQS